MTMALLDRVATIVRANLNDLADKTENPENMLKQVIRDIENQYMQVKTQAAIAFADLNLMLKKRTETEEQRGHWMIKAERAVEKRDDQMARAALRRVVGMRRADDELARQIADQQTQVESLKSVLRRLEAKLSEAREQVELLIVRHRRPQAANRAATIERAAGPNNASERMRSKAMREEALGEANGDLPAPDLDAGFEELELDDKVDELLEGIKARKGL
jgi:phage shock protein A